jgi:hypothetical protein
MHEGGPENGVLTALEDAREQAAEPWEMRLVPGFGGVAVVLAAELATPERWLAILPDEILERTLGRLELANAQLRLDRERLLEELDEAAAVSGASTVLSDLSQLAERLAAVDRSEAHDRARVERLIDAAIDDSERRVDRERRRTRAAERGLAAEQAARAAVEVELEHARTTIDELDHRTREMEGTAADLADELARARTENEELISAHADELAFVAEQVRLAAGSQAWRWGHRAARAGRRLTFRRSRGTDSLTKVLNRIAPQDDVEPTPPAD